MDVAAGTEHALVPTFLLQPLVENALRHGLQHRLAATSPGQRGLLTIQSGRDGDRLVLTVRDNGVGVADDVSARRRSASVSARRASGSRASTAIATRSRCAALPEGGTEVRITLPFRAAPAEVAQHAHGCGC